MYEMFYRKNNEITTLSWQYNTIRKYQAGMRKNQMAFLEVKTLNAKISYD